MILLANVGFVCPPVHANEFVLDDQLKKTNLNPYIDCIEDVRGNLDFDQIRGQFANKRFFHLNNSQFQPGFRKSTFWLRLVVTNPLSHDITWYLEYDYPHIDYLTLYVPTSDGYRIIQTGDRYPFSKRPIAYRNFVFRLTESPGQRTYYIRVIPGGATVLRINGYSQAAFDLKRHQEDHLLWISYGIMIAFGIYNLFVFLTFRDRTYLYLVFCISCIFMFSFTYNGLSAQYLWPDFPEWANLCHPILVFLTGVSSLLFSREFLNTKHHLPKLDTILVALMALGICGMVTPFADYFFSAAMSGYFGMTVGIILLAAGMASFLTCRSTAALIFVVSWSGFLIGSFCLALQLMGLLQNHGFYTWAHQAGAVVLAVWLSLAVSDRVNTLMIERTNALNALKNSEKKYRNIFENASEGIFQARLDGTFITMNPALARMLGYHPSKSEIKQSQYPINELRYVHSDTHPRLINRLLADRFVKGFETQVYRKDGRVIHISMNVHLVNDANGDPEFFEGIVEDISQRKQAEKLKIEKEAAEALAKSKSQFLANMSHEIRTPLNAIIGFTDLCLKNQSMVIRCDYLEKIRTSAKSLMGILNAVLDFSKIESGKLMLEAVRFQLDEVLANLAVMFSRKASGKKIEFIISVSRDVPYLLIGDPLRLTQILINLVGNAFKFTETGEILVDIQPEKRLHNQIVLKFRVKDTGTGIDPESLPKLFEAFVQADGSTTRRFGGTGLGLSISKHLVEMMKGTIGVDSEPGKGSTFFFTAGFGLDPSDREAIQGITGLFHAKSIVVISPHPTLLTALCKTLEGILSETVIIKISSLTDLSACGTLERPGMIIMDWQGQDRKAILKTIQQIPNLSQVPLILLTDTEKETIWLASRHVTGQIQKPVTRMALINALKNWVQDEKAPASIEATKNKMTDPIWLINQLKGLRVLLVEDNPINQEVAMELLNHVGVITEIAESGIRALEKLESMAFDAVLMDVQMPEMDGITATRLIRQDSRFDQLPIIGMTAHALKGDQDRCFQAGMNAYLSKPIESDRLYRTLITLVGKKNASQPKFTDPIHQLDGFMMDPVSFDEHGHIDFDTGLNRILGNLRLYEKVLTQFVENYSDMAVKIRHAVEARQVNIALPLIHDIKGVAGNISANALHDLLMTMETEIRRGRWETLPALLTTLDEKLKVTIQTAERFCQYTETQMAHPDSSDTDTPGETPQDVITTLSQLLATNNARAETYLTSHIHSLRTPENASLVHLLTSQVNRYDFKSARVTLSEIADTLDVATIIRND